MQPHAHMVAHAHMQPHAHTHVRAHTEARTEAEVESRRRADADGVAHTHAAEQVPSFASASKPHVGVRDAAYLLA
eukprot:1051346-Pleurochrysis_carterae.AAC.1